MSRHKIFTFVSYFTLIQTNVVSQNLTLSFVRIVILR